MNFTIKSRKTGEIFSFYAPDRGGYVHLESPGHSGNTGAQICRGGGFMGSTLSCGASVDDLASVARKWYRQYMEERRKYLTLMSQLEDLL
ncbi:TPA: hypothetical protein ACN7S9_004244 [Klebsiella pneumoniae]|uniref:hypothetical protein n=1 Tax=Klebsiella pneumoniae TaxID=573 RepID=UPI00211892A3|nr:hypothetical protein [Klebsiella pneumoniae]HDU3662925.1 hypothetical protein [Klebsiella pneumoniae subsp. pneumoniae]MCQ8625436.1 hypothetical protein [Klebsiella pneumoniae]HDU3724410.1 hypothetical protein [Klebsiella pneumoniae subsp. pneumoniae]HDU3735603.1 hypothetical protein [Klebsiella pneumoniae subsp. pneumoniae]HDU5903556.1 hypothetical protein [Klebsiella pneumoniae subsp. pneumoniae]